LLKPYILYVYDYITFWNFNCLSRIVRVQNDDFIGFRNFSIVLNYVRRNYWKNVEMRQPTYRLDTIFSSTWKKAFGNNTLKKKPRHCKTHTFVAVVSTSKIRTRVYLVFIKPLCEYVRCQRTFASSRHVFGEQSVRLQQADGCSFLKMPCAPQNTMANYGLPERGKGVLTRNLRLFKRMWTRWKFFLYNWRTKVFAHTSARTHKYYCYFTFSIK